MSDVDMKKELEIMAISNAVKMLIKLVLPSLRKAARGTDNPYDDAAVALLESIVS